MLAQRSCPAALDLYNTKKCSLNGKDDDSVALKVRYVTLTFKISYPKHPHFLVVAFIYLAYLKETQPLSATWEQGNHVEDWQLS